MRVDRSTMRDEISKVSMDAIRLRQTSNVIRAFQESICCDCPDRNKDVCPRHACHFARRSILGVIDILVKMEIGDN